MNIKKVSLVYFSATDVTKKYVRAMGKAVSDDVVEYNFTLPEDRNVEKAPKFTEDDFVIFGVPVYSGRIPSFCLEYLNAVKGNNTPCVVVASYGNRAYDDALVEMEDVATETGFKVVGAAAVVGRHSFSDNIAGTRPDAKDLEGAASFMKLLAEKEGKVLVKGTIPGNRPYVATGYAPNPMMPSTTDACIGCGVCAENCPNGVISKEDPSKMVKSGTECFMCNSCVTKCPVGAKVFDFDAFRRMVARCEAGFGKPDRENEFYM